MMDITSGCSENRHLPVIIERGPNHASRDGWHVPGQEPCRPLPACRPAGPAGGQALVVGHWSLVLATMKTVAQHSKPLRHSVLGAAAETGPGAATPASA